MTADALARRQILKREKPDDHLQIMTMKTNLKFAACPSDAPATSGCEAEHPRKAAPIYAFQELNFAEAQPFVQKFHYLHKIGGGAFIFFGAFIGDVLQVVACLGQCANKECPADFIELKRLVARPNSPVRLSQFLAQIARIMKQRGHPALVAWADPDFGHHGGVYQAANWTHTETRKGHNQARIFITEKGERVHGRTISSRHGTADVNKILALHPKWRAIRAAPKFRYLLPLNMRLRKCCELMRTRPIPYPKGTK